MLNKIFKNRSAKSYLVYFLSFLITVLTAFLLMQLTSANDFFTSMENRTFDLRQNLLAKSNFRKASKDIVIIAIDDASYEYLLGKYGEWPIPRDVYADMVNYIEKQNPRVIVFDLMFVKSMKSKKNADEALTNAIVKNKNVYVAMNFDNQSFDIRKPTKLPPHLSVKLQNDSKINFNQDLSFSNCRAILPQILNNTKNVGLINVSRADDGILRKMPPFLRYQNNFYPHLSLLVGLEYLKQTEGLNVNDFHIDKNANLLLGKRSISIDEDGGAILNWYGSSGTKFKHIPFYKVVKAMHGDKSVPEYDFKNKIVYVGTSAVSLYDTKSVPVDKLYPGVEVHATYVNNLIDNDFIRKVNNFANILISAILALFIGLVVLRTNSTIISLGATIVTIFGYIIFTYYMMKFFSFWFAIVFPILSILLIFVLAYIAKYLLKSRDFEYQYKLATTDGLTELYNHRFFQEQMLMQVENCKRYDSHFSLILIDIDFFKKFNDTYGHQAGDAVLRQVAHALKKNVRSTDVVCRYGGEEMSIILSNTDKDEAIITAQKICQAVAQKPFKLGPDLEGVVTISLGVATYPQDGSTSSALIEHADKVLYKAKENGRNQVGL